ncbi:hypothetical protein [Pantanalinema sp. GBBB05]|uniref:hypothetical protein n=1 Tax=Pantanalinema sp. GBBB05 TaxID=2604139 RepID=UPI001DE7C3B3|nr:hypothetical protein [Pantanalinema sp. GBBB05]
MQLVIFPRLSTRSKRAFLKQRGKYGRVYYYNPRWPLVERLSRELGMPAHEVIDRAWKEREFILKRLP